MSDDEPFSRMTEQQTQELGDTFRDAVLARTGLKAEELWCPREKSDMTPCVARDGGICVVLDTFGHPICVGCETRIDRRLEEERVKSAVR